MILLKKEIPAFKSIIETNLNEINIISLEKATSGIESVVQDNLNERKKVVY